MSGPDYLVAGQGIAGTVFALSAIARGKRVLVVDPREGGTCSRVAAGLMNPVTGPRFALGPREADYWKAAGRFYREWENTLGVRFFEERPILRLFTGGDQKERWTTRFAESRYAPWHATLPGDWDGTRYRAEHGGFTTRNCGRLDTVVFLDSAREWLRDKGSFEPGLVEPGRKDGRITVWCLGYLSLGQGPFQAVPLRPARGTILTVRVPGLREGRILHAGKWLVPIGGEFYRVGSTYEWDPQDPAPSAEGRAELAAFLDGFLRLPWTLVHEEAGIRPMANRGRPFLGRHPDHPEQVLFNGLGSRGATLAPWHADRLLDHLESGSALDPEVAVGRWMQG